MGLYPNVVQEATNSDGIFGLVAAGVGVSLYSDSAANLRRKGIVIKPLEAGPQVQTLAAWRRDNANPARAARFVSLALGNALNPGTKFTLSRLPGTCIPPRSPIVMLS